MRHKSLPVFLTLIIVSILSILSAYLILNMEQDRVRYEFNEDAKEHITAVQNAIYYSLEVLHAIHAFYASSNKEIERKQFDTFASLLLSHHSYIQTLKWVPQVSHAERADLEAALQKDYPDFHFTERSEQGEIVTAAECEVYFPIRYIVPYVGNENILGFDLASDAKILAVLNQSRDTGTIGVIAHKKNGDEQYSSLESRLKLSSKNFNLENMLVFFPLYQNDSPINTLVERREYLRGFIVGVFRLNEIVNEALRRIKPKGIDFIIREESDTPTDLYTHYSRTRTETTDLTETGKLFLKETFKVAEQTWSIIALSYPDKERSWMALGTLIVGLLGTLLIMAYLFSTIKQATQLEQSEKALRESEEYWRLLIEESQTGLVLFSMDSTFLDANPAFVNIVGYSVDELRQKTFWEITEERHQLDTDQFILLEKTGRCGPYEKTVICKDGDHVPIRISAVIVERKGDAFIWANIEDISDHKQSEIKLLEAVESAKNAKIEAESANQAKSTFLANMSHELRTPLNGILGFAQVLKRDKSLNTQQQDAIRTIQQSGEHLLVLLNDILDMSKVEAGKMEWNKKDFYFPHFISSIVNIINIRAQQKDIPFYQTLGLNLPAAVNADEIRLRQVLINLLGNAVKFTNEGQVIFQVTQHENKTRFQVEDTGKGIAPNDLKNIFQPFKQVGDYTSQSEGTGLGLAISKKLLEMMGATLQVKSTLNKGSVFWFDLALPPAKEWQQVVDETPKLFVKGFKGKPCKILIVDDKEANRAVLNSLLSPLGFEIIEAPNGLIAIEKASAEHPDLILMDLVMPVMNGIEATNRIRQLNELSKLVIIAASASTFKQDQEKSLVAGCNDFIAKPIQTDEMLEKLRKHLKLEWVYDAEDLQTTVEQPIVGPPKESAKILFDFAMQGNVDRLIELANELEKTDDKYKPFATALLQLANEFKVQKIRDLIKPYL